MHCGGRHHKSAAQLKTSNRPPRTSPERPTFHEPTPEPFTIRDQVTEADKNRLLFTCSITIVQVDKKDVNRRCRRIPDSYPYSNLSVIVR